METIAGDLFYQVRERLVSAVILVLIANGLNDDEIQAIGTSGDGLDQVEQLLCDVADELTRDKVLSADVWAKLNEHFDTRQVMDIVFTVGQYTMLAMALNTFVVQLDEGLPRFEF